MASFLYICHACLGTRRIENTTRPADDFDYICPDCRETAVAEAPPSVDDEPKKKKGRVKK